MAKKKEVTEVVVKTPEVVTEEEIVELTPEMEEELSNGKGDDTDE